MNHISSALLTDFTLIDKFSQPDHVVYFIETEKVTLIKADKDIALLNRETQLSIAFRQMFLT